MRYALLIHDDEAAWAALPPEDLAARMQEYEKFSNGLIERGLMRGGEQLRPSVTATTVCMSEGKVLTLDGPFCETKEVLGGFFIIECDTLDQAIEAASAVPSVKFGGVIEVRPLTEAMHEEEHP